jgi:uncharacterized membrane protein YdjX (TVP38/TMEM64 family)
VRRVFVDFIVSASGKESFTGRCEGPPVTPYGFFVGAALAAARFALIPRSGATPGPILALTRVMAQMHGSPSRSLWKGIAALLAAAALIATWHLLPLRDWMDSFEARVKGMGFSGGILYVAVYVAASLLFVPGSILSLGAGYVFGVAGGMVVVWIGVTAAAAAGFLVARYLARSGVERLARRNARFGALDAAIGKSGWKAVGLVRLSALVPFSLSNYFFGLTSVRFGPYVAATAVAMVPGSFFYVYLGAAGKGLALTGQRSAWEWAVIGGGVVVTAATAVILARFTKKQLERSQTSTAPTGSAPPPTP